MQFLNLAMLFGLLAIAVPVILHLLNRKAARFVDWGAIQFLQESVVSRRRRILLEEILLLGSRCLLVTLVTLALARPFVPAASRVPWIVVMPMMVLAMVAFGVSFALWRYPFWRILLLLVALALIGFSVVCIALEKRLNLKRLGQDVRRDIAIVIDGSTSMTVEVDGKTNFERAIEEAKKSLELAGPRTTFALILGGSVPATLLPGPVSDRDTLTELLDDLEPAGGMMQVLETFSAATVALAQGYHPAKQILVITDAQRVGWETENAGRWTFLTNAFGNLPTQPQIICRKLPLPDEFRNAAVADITFSRDVIGVDRPVDIRVRVENTGTEAITPAELILDLDGEKLRDNTMGQIVPGSSETLSFSHRFKRPGSCVVRVGMEVDDELDEDNTRVAVVNVIRALPVLIVDGDPTSRFLERAGAFIALALAPARETAKEDEEEGGPQAARTDFLVVPDIVDASGIAKVTSFAKYGAVILANVPRLPSEAAKRLALYVAGGGGLLIAPGARAQPDFYNAWMAGEARPLIPARLASRVVQAEDADPIKPSLSTFGHSSLRMVADASQSDIGTVGVSAYWRLDENTADNQVGVGGRLENGDALLVERKLGRGVVLLTACSLDTSGSNLATRHAFLPLIHEMVYYLARAAMVTMNLEPAPEMALRLSCLDIRTAKDAHTAINVEAPDGEKRKGEIAATDDGVVARVEGKMLPGLYRIEVPDALKKDLAPLLARDGSIPFTVVSDAAEGRLASLDETDTRFVSKYTDFVEAESTEDLEKALKGKAFGDELWKYMAVAALLLLVAEAALTRWIAVQRRTGHEGTVQFEDKLKPSAAFRRVAERVAAYTGTD